MKKFVIIFLFIVLFYIIINHFGCFQYKKKDNQLSSYKQIFLNETDHSYKKICIDGVEYIIHMDVDRESMSPHFRQNGKLYLCEDRRLKK